MAKTLAQIIQEASKDFSVAPTDDTARFIGKHILQKNPHPVAPDAQFSGNTVKDKSKISGYHDGEDEAVNEKKLSDAEKKRKEEVLKGMKDAKKDFVKRYGKDAEAVMHGKATNAAKNEELEITDEMIEEVRNSLAGQNQGIFDRMVENDREAAEDFVRMAIEEEVVDEAMSVTLKPHGNNQYKVHSVGSKMKKHGGIKAGETIHDRHIDDLHDSGIKVNYHGGKK